MNRSVENEVMHAHMNESMNGQADIKPTVLKRNQPFPGSVPFIWNIIEIFAVLTPKFNE